MANNQIEVIKTTKRNPMLSKEGFTFHYNKDGVEIRIWTCSKRVTDLKCPVRLHTTQNFNNPKLIRENGHHNHPPNPIEVDVKRVIGQMKDEASSSTAPPTQIIARNVRTLSSASQGALPLVQSMTRGIRNARAKSIGSLAIPHRREDIDLPDSYQTCSNGEDFLLFDSGKASDRLLIFTTHKNLEFLSRSDVWMADGTFKVAPSLFDQLFVIHGLRDKTCFPLVYCLTPNRITDTYTRVLSALKTLKPGLNPSSVMTDYEKAFIKAFHQAFPMADQKGCFFHFTQCVHRQIQQRPDIFHLYSTDSEFALKIRHLVALAFVPPEEVVLSFEELMEDEFFVQNEALLLDFIGYFERTWLGPFNLRRTERIAPIFSITLWNCFHSVLEELPKTNNNCEGFHNALASLLGASHPTIYKLVDGLKDKQTLTQLKMNQFNAGTVPPPNKKYQRAAKQLQAIVERYGDGEFSQVEYLRRIAYQIQA